MIKTIVETIIWIADKRFKKYKYKSINSFIHEVFMEVVIELAKYMDTNK